MDLNNLPIFSLISKKMSYLNQIASNGLLLLVQVAHLLGNERKDR